MRTTFTCLLFGFVFLYTIFSLIKITTSFTPDFSIFYGATRNLIQNENPYTNVSLYSLFPYPPVTAIFYIPFIVFPYAFSQTIFTILSFFCVFGIIFLTQIMLRKFQLVDFMLFSSVALLSFPVKFTLGMGQINIIAFFLILFSFFLFKNHKIFLAAPLLTIGVILKPIYVFLLIYFFTKADLKFVNIFMSSLLLFLVLSFVFFGFEVNAYYLQFITPHFADVDGREVYYNQGIMGFTSRLTEHTLTRKVLAYSFSFIVLIIPLVLKKKNLIDDIAFFSSLTAALVLIDPLAWQHHFIILIAPFIYCYYILIRYKNYILLTYLGISYLLVSINIQQPQNFNMLPQKLILSHVFYGGLLLFGVLVYSIFRYSRRS